MSPYMLHLKSCEKKLEILPSHLTATISLSYQLIINNRIHVGIPTLINDLITVSDKHRRGLF